MIYLDNSATTKPYKEVLDVFTKVASHYFGNPSSVNALGSEAEKLLNQSREVISKLLNIHPSEIVFTSGGTEGNNIAVKGTALKYRSRGKHIITTTVEHASIYEGYKQLEQLGFEITFLPVNERGRISIDQVQRAIRKDTILVSVIHVNNEVGSIQPITEIGEMLKKYPHVLFHVDHVQGIGKVPLDFKRSNVDLCTVSGHKFHSVKGTGFLYVRKGIKLEPLFTGGSQENSLRAGTENVSGIVAMTKALRMTMDHQQNKIAHLTHLKNLLFQFVEKTEQTVLNTPKEWSAPHIINFSIPGAKPEVIVHALEEHQIYVSTKSACSSKQTSASRILLEMGKDERVAESAIRISFSAETTIEEVKKCMAVIEDILQQNKVIMR
ncbi:cysteine desulfurase family protein [Bacillus salitolerans]|uniref:Cysteine desulfurase family protein n=1 Tax=Bacillus salitolerans TaxID=1437434 RepID=A0ABW4LW48_9BACI